MKKKLENSKNLSMSKDELFVIKGGVDYKLNSACSKEKGEYICGSDNAS